MIKANNVAIKVDKSILQISNSKDTEDFYCLNFHNLDTNQFKQHVLYTELNDARKNGLTCVENSLWGNDYDKARQARLVVEHFDELEPEGQKGKLSGFAVAAFMTKFGIGCSDKKLKTFVEDYFNVIYKGKYKTIKTNTVDDAKNKIATEKSRFDVGAFNKKIDDLLNRYFGNSMGKQ